MLVLRTAALTNRWHETLEHARASMATNRRLDWKWRSPDMPVELKGQHSTPRPEPHTQEATAYEGRCMIIFR